MAVKLSRAASRLLDVFRGVAALLVVAGHSREYAARFSGLNPSGSSMLEKLVLAPTSLAMEAVAVFFVLSGFLVGGQLLRQNREGRFSWSGFLVKRLTRLWTVLLPGLLVTWILWIAVSPWSLEALPSEQSGLKVALCNAAYLQGAWCAYFSNNASLWSLSYEFWFYVVFAAASVAFFSASRGRIAVALINVTVLTLAVFLFGISLLYLIPAWLIGVVVAWLSERANPLRKAVGTWPWASLALSMVLLCVGFAMSNLLHLNRIALTCLIALPSALVIFSMLFVQHEPAFFRQGISAGVRFGHWSFSIYVYHLPLVIALLTVFQHTGLITRFGLPVTTYVTLTLVLPVTVALWWLTERHTDKVRSWVTHALALRAAARRQLS